MILVNMTKFNAQTPVSFLEVKVLYDEAYALKERYGSTHADFRHKMVAAIKADLAYRHQLKSPRPYSPFISSETVHIQSVPVISNENTPAGHLKTSS